MSARFYSEDLAAAYLVLYVTTGGPYILLPGTAVGATNLPVGWLPGSLLNRMDLYEVFARISGEPSWRVMVPLTALAYTNVEGRL
jgi:hypothetical protein